MAYLCQLLRQFVFCESLLVFAKLPILRAESGKFCGKFWTHSGKFLWEEKNAATGAIVAAFPLAI